MLHRFEKIFIWPSGTWTCWTCIEHLLNASECAWTPMSEYWAAPEHLLGEHECQCVSIEHPLSAHECHWVIIECDSPWCDHKNDRICVRTDLALNTSDCTWIPLSDYWTPTECLWVHVNANEWVLNTQWTPNECACTPMSEWEQPLNTHWMCMNTFE
jgi:hypothetical protein